MIRTVHDLSQKRQEVRIIEVTSKLSLLEQELMSLRRREALWSCLDTDPYDTDPYGFDGRVSGWLGREMVACLLDRWRT